MKTKFAAAILAALFLLSACAAPQETEQDKEEVKLRDTVLYYADENGLVVPVVRSIQWEEGIGKAAVRSLVDSEGNSAFLEAHGLVPTLPAGTTVDLRIVDGAAKLSLSPMPECESAQQERNLVTSVVNTLMEFSTVDSVQILIDGTECDALPLGTDVSEAFGRIGLNSETAAASAGGSGGGKELTLHFPNYDSSLCVPVTREVAADITLEGALEELLHGPAQTDALRSCFPEGTRLLGVTVEGGVARVDLSAEAENLLEHPKLSQRAQESTALCCAQFGVPAAVLCVEGTPLFGTTPVMAQSAVNDFAEG